MPDYKHDEYLEEIVRKFRKRIGLEFKLRTDMMTIIIKAKVAFPGFNYRRVPDEELAGVEAQWDSKNWTLVIPESVFRAMQRDEPRARMTIAHELSHFLLGHTRTLNRSTNNSVVERTVRTVRRQENEAKRCGPIILAPEYLVPEIFESTGIAHMFGLSKESSEYRKEEVDRFRRRARKEYRPLPEKAHKLLLEAKQRGKRLRTPLDDQDRG